MPGPSNLGSGSRARCISAATRRSRSSRAFSASLLDAPVVPLALVRDIWPAPAAHLSLAQPDGDAWRKLGESEVEAHLLDPPERGAEGGGVAALAAFGERNCGDRHGPDSVLSNHCCSS